MNYTPAYRVNFTASGSYEQQQQTYLKIRKLLRIYLTFLTDLSLFGFLEIVFSVNRGPVLSESYCPYLSAYKINQKESCKTPKPRITLT